MEAVEDRKLSGRGEEGEFAPWVGGWVGERATAGRRGPCGDGGGSGMDGGESSQGSLKGGGGSDGRRRTGQ